MPLDLTIVARVPHQVRCAEAVRAGVEAIGGRARIGAAPVTKQVACWGWRAGQQLRAAGHDVLVMERGYLGDRFEWYSLGWNGLNGRAEFRSPAVSGRFAANFTLQPWRDGDHILIAGQVPGDMSLQGRNLLPWYRDVATQARQWGMRIVFRRHPEVAKRGFQAAPYGAHLSTGSLLEDLARAHLCITWNSNTAVDAVVAGVPAVTMDQGSMAWDVTGHAVMDRLLPDRDAWADRVASCQWKLDEIASGEPFRHVLRQEGLAGS